MSLLILRKVFGSATLLFAFLTGSLGNAFVIYVFSHKKKQRTHYERLVSLLAVCDLLTSLTLPLLNLYVLLSDYKEWHFGSTGCKLLPVFSYMSMTASQSILLMITYERYVKIKDPLKNAGVGSRTMVAWVLGTLAVIIVSSVARAIGFHVKEYNDGTDRTRCTYDDPGFGIGVAYSSMVLWLVVLVTIVILSCKSARYLQRQREIVQFASMIHRAARLRKSRRALIIVVAVFTLTTMPLSLLLCVLTTMKEVVSSDYSERELLIIEGLNLYCQWLRTLSCAANVLIYSKMFFKEFKTHFKALLCRQKQQQA